jgi:uncharacterized glyoxalase superfamily protein PhnB
MALMLLVENVDEALAWYGEVFGAELHASLPQTPPFEWVSLLLDDVEIMFGQKRAAQDWYSHKVTISETLANFIAYVYVKDVNSLSEQIKDKVAVIMAPTDQAYGIREFAIQDHLGFIWVFAQIHQGVNA